MKLPAYWRSVVACSVPGRREIARDGVNARLVPSDGAAAMAAAIRRLARNLDLRKQFAAAGRKLVEEQFAAERSGHKTVALCDGLLHRRIAVPAASRQKG